MMIIKIRLIYVVLNDSGDLQHIITPNIAGHTLSNSTSWEVYKECRHWCKTLGNLHLVAVHLLGSDGWMEEIIPVPRV